MPLQATILEPEPSKDHLNDAGFVFDSIPGDSLSLVVHSLMAAEDYFFYRTAY